MNRTAFQGELHGFTILERLEFFVEPGSGIGTLLLHLSRDSSTNTDMVRARFDGVTGLSAKNLGGGLTQLLYLVVEDIRDQRLDRLNYAVAEVEKDSIRFMCRDVFIERVVSQ
jgi:hypothetical protein